MRILLTTSFAVMLLIKSVNGQAVDGSNVYRYFGSCYQRPCRDANAECCSFDAGFGIEGNFCMTNEQKIDPVTLKKTYFGKYIDNEYTEWDWVCAAPTAAEIAE